MQRFEWSSLPPVLWVDLAGQESGSGKDSRSETEKPGACAADRIDRDTVPKVRSKGERGREIRRGGQWRRPSCRSDCRSAPGGMDFFHHARPRPISLHDSPFALVERHRASPTTSGPDQDLVGPIRVLRFSFSSAEMAHTRTHERLIFLYKTHRGKRACCSKGRTFCLSPFTSGTLRLSRYSPL